MKEEIKIPQMGESVTEASIANFLKADGTQVSEGEEIVELETEKVNQVLYAPCSGVIKWTVKQGDNVKIGDVIGSIDSEQKPKAAEPKKAPPAEKPKLEEKRPSDGEGKRVMAEAFVEELKVPPQVKPAEPKKERPAEKEGRETRRPMTKIRQTIATRLVDALHNAAMLTTFNEVDMSEIIRLRAKYKESFVKEHQVKLGFMSFFVKAVVEALKKFPDFNSYLEGTDIVTRQYYDIGIAVGTERGLVVPVVRGCDWLSFADIERAIEGYAKKAKEGRLAIEDLQGGGFTITNGGVYGSLLSTPILNPPQVGILGMHKILKRAVVVEDAIVIRPMMYLALSYDHRVVDGKEAVSFLVFIKEVLEDPCRMIFLDSDGQG